MAKDFNIKNNAPPVTKGDTKYIIKGLATKAISTEIYKAGVTASNSRGGGVNPDKSLYSSSLGTPVLADITIPSFEYTLDNVSYTVPEIKLYTIILIVDGQKNIVKTSIQGLNGTIKEYISDGDDTLTIKGKIVGKNGNHPFQQVNDLKKLINAPVAFKIVSKWLQNLDIDTLIIESYHLPQDEGSYSYQDFELNCSTDFPIELNIVSASNTTGVNSQI